MGGGVLVDDEKHGCGSWSGRLRMWTAERRLYMVDGRVLTADMALRCGLVSSAVRAVSGPRGETGMVRRSRFGYYHADLGHLLQSPTSLARGF